MIIKIQTYIDALGKHRKKCLVKCDKCSIDGWRNDYYSVAKRKEHICIKCSNKANGAMRIGIPSPFKGKKRKKDSEYILGSTYLNSSGYLEEYVGKEAYPDKRGGYYLQHRKIIEEHLGRKLLKKELVHHIDGNKTNNNIDNLHVCASISKHRIIHTSLMLIAFELLNKNMKLPLQTAMFDRNSVNSEKA